MTGEELNYVSNFEEIRTTATKTFREVPLKSFLPIAATAFLLASGCESKAPDPKIAPDFNLKDLDGKDVTLSSFRGKAVLVNFWGAG